MPKLGMEPIRREQIRRAAARIIAKRGFDGTTLMDIAKAAGVSTGTINHYYPGKSAVVLDTLLYVSEWFQSQIKAAVDRADTGPGKLKALVEVGVFGATRDYEVGHLVWIWAIAESLRSKPLRAMIQERRRLFQEILAGVIRALDLGRALDDSEVAAFAAEWDAYLNGISTHHVTGESKLRPADIERSLLSMALARIAAEEPPQRRRAAG